MTTESLASICGQNSLMYVLLIFCAGITTGMILYFIYKLSKLGENKQ